MAMIEAQRWCDHCQRLVLARRRVANHLVHAALTIIFLGLWLVIWVFAAISAGDEPWRCAVCGGTTRLSEAQVIAAAKQKRRRNWSKFIILIVIPLAIGAAVILLQKRG